jgi:hypothetical protein
MEVFEYRGKWGGVRHLGQTWVSEEVVPSDPRDVLRAKSHQLRWLQMSGRTARIAAPVGPAGKGAGRLTSHNQEQSVDQEAAGSAGPNWRSCLEHAKWHPVTVS